MKHKARMLHSLISFTIICSLALWTSAAVVGAPTAIEIRDWYDLHAVRENLNGHYRLMNHLDATTSGYAELAGPTANQGQGWQPIGTRLSTFTGSFDGQGYEIRDLSAERSAEEGVGLFGFVGEQGVIEYLGVVQTTVTGHSYVGAVAGWSAGTVSNCHSAGVVMGSISVGGLVGLGSQGAVSNSYSATTVIGDGSVGGLVGWNAGNVNNSYSTGDVSGNMSVGGLVGHNVGSPQGGTVSNSYSTGSVTGEQRVGGLIGYNLGGTIRSSFWDMITSATEFSDGGIGKTSAEMKALDTFSQAAWDIAAVASGAMDSSYVWNIVKGETYPFLTDKQLVQCDLTLSSTHGGQVVTPGESSFVYAAGTVVTLVAEPEDGYRFVAWSGNTDTIGEVNAVHTTITMHGDCDIVAVFEEVPPERVNRLLIGLLAAVAAIAAMTALWVRRKRAPRARRR
ncbi:MAG: GLUG motif-containing protein [Dehalococcoidia bacterium]